MKWSQKVKCTQFSLFRQSILIFLKFIYEFFFFSYIKKKILQRKRKYFFTFKIRINSNFNSWWRHLLNFMRIQSEQNVIILLVLPKRANFTLCRHIETNVYSHCRASSLLKFKKTNYRNVNSTSIFPHFIRNGKQHCIEIQRFPGIPSGRRKRSQF